MLDFHAKEPDVGTRKLSKIFTEKFGRFISRSSIVRIQQQKEKIRQIPLKFRRKQRMMDKKDQAFLDRVYEDFVKKLLKTSMSKSGF